MKAGISQRQTPRLARRGLSALFPVMILVMPCRAAADFDQTHSLYDALLKARVVAGRVDYPALKADPRALHGYLDSLAAVPEGQFRGWSEAQQLAFLFNLYNATTLKLIVDHYPVDSIKDIGNWLKGPWDRKTVRLFGGTITLNNLEHDILRKDYHEPRLHLALVCAAKGCPPLRDEAYTAAKLDSQLDDQARTYLSSPAGLRLDRRAGKVWYSAIFKWYGGDFIPKYTPRTGFRGLNETERAVASFSSRYLPEVDRKYLQAGGYRVQYLHYDWSLNEGAGRR